jgi:predicted TIM-barrel fold metal-dependent hydrolase
MVIDTDVHLVGRGWVKLAPFSRGMFAGHAVVRQPKLTESYKKRLEKGPEAYNRIHGTNLNAQEYLNEVRRPWLNILIPPGDTIIKWMDESGVDKIVTFGIDWAYAISGESKVTNREQNKIHADVAKNFLKRIKALCALDPRRPDAVEQLTEAVEEWGMSGLKLMPQAGFAPDDPVCFPLYEKCADYDLPISCHTGVGFNSMPLHIAVASSHFPEIAFIACHCSAESHEQARWTAMRRPNVFLDMGTLQEQYQFNHEEFYKWFRGMLDYCGPWKICFASDSPDGSNWVTEKDWVKVFKEPKTSVKFTKEEMEIVLGKAAQEIFNFPE